jgi:type II secretory pathway pseudopilin PulG
MNKKHTAFTTAELMIALALIGLVATFATPKIYRSLLNSQERSAFREVVSVLEQLYYQGASQGIKGAALNQFVMQHINASKTCMNTVADGCFYIGNSQYGGIVEDSGSMAGFEMPSGAVVNSINLTTTNAYDEIVIDINGSNGVSAYSGGSYSSKIVDRIVLNVCLDVGCNSLAVQAHQRLSREVIGLLEPCSIGDQVNRYNELMGNS